MSVSSNFDKPHYNPPTSEDTEPIDRRIPSNMSSEGAVDPPGSDEHEFTALDKDIRKTVNVDEFELLAARANQDGESFLEADDIHRARAYIADHLEEIENAFNSEVKKGCYYIVLSKGHTGLNYNLEFHGHDTPTTLRVYLRHDSDFDGGNTKIASSMIDIFRLELLVKTKIIRMHQKPTVDESKKEVKRVEDVATEYRKVRHSFLNAIQMEPKEGYCTYPQTLQMVFEELSLGIGIDSVLQARHIVLYTKEMARQGETTVKLERIGVYTLKQDGPVKAKYFKNDLERLQATLGIVENTIDLHKHGLVHNDLKGTNFLWTRTKDGIKTKVIDLGLASKINSMDNYTLSSSLPPEVLRRKESIKNMTEETRIQRNKAKEAWELGETILRDVYGTAFWIPVNLMNSTEEILTTLKFMERPQHEWIFPKNMPLEVQELVKGLLTLDPVKRMSLEEARDFLAVLLK